MPTGVQNVNLRLTTPRAFRYLNNSRRRNSTDSVRFAFLRERAAARGDTVSGVRRPSAPTVAERRKTLKIHIAIVCGGKY